ncbi:MAG: hypothetical protein ACLFSJ_05145 [Halorhodospira sp.]
MLDTGKMARGRRLIHDLRARLQGDPAGRSAAKVTLGGGLTAVGVLWGVGDAATLLVGLLIAAGLAAAGRQLEPADGLPPLSLRRGEGLNGHRHLLAYGAALAVAGYALVNIAVSIALLIGGALLLRAGWAERAEPPSRGLATDTQRLLQGVEADVRRALTEHQPRRRDG